MVLSQCKDMNCILIQQLYFLLQNLKNCLLCNFKKEKMIHKERLKTTAWLHLYAHWGKLLFVFSLNIHNKTCGFQYFKLICVLWKAFEARFSCLIFLISNPYITAYIGLCSGNLCYNMVEEQSYNDLYKPLYKGLSDCQKIIGFIKVSRSRNKIVEP